MGSARTGPFTDESASALSASFFSRLSPPRRTSPGSGMGRLRRPSTCWLPGHHGPCTRGLGRPVIALDSLFAWQQRRGLFPMEPRRHCRLQVREHRSALLTARRHHRPDPLTPPLSPLPPPPL